MTSQQILAIHPGPWRHANSANQPGLIVMLDATNKVVELFTMIEFVQSVTLELAQQQPQPQPASAPL